MPSWTKKDRRQYEYIKDSGEDWGKSEDRAEEIAARTVNKHRRESGKTPNSTTQGTDNPSTTLEDRSVDELRNLAAEHNIRGRSKMRKAELVDAIRAHR